MNLRTTIHTNCPAAFCLAALFLCTGSARCEIPDTILHTFGGISDGSQPYSGLTLIGSTLYGTTSMGGGGGTVFKINTDGTGYARLVQFTGGASPRGALVYSASTLYGATYGGTVFKVNTNGTGFATVATVGGFPSGGLALSGSTLYGTTGLGGRFGYGTVFKVNFDGTGLSTLHDFNSQNDGQSPLGDLTISGSTVFGTTSAGGPSAGTVFKINTDGTGFVTLHSFFGGNADGGFPQAGVTISGSAMYGTTYLGGPSESGTIYKMNVDGTSFQLLHTFPSLFSNDPSDGNSPYSGVTLSGSTLYGTAQSGGSNRAGLIYQIATDGSGYQVLHNFAATPPDSGNPEGGMAFDGHNLYGTTLSTLFTIAVPEPGAACLTAIATGGIISLCTRRRSGLFHLRKRRLRGSK
jgi:uncharacterized repeat protein (TIGR03803 family)